MVKDITLVRRGCEVVASFEGDRGIPGHGRTINEAVGELVLLHPEEFGIVNWSQADAETKQYFKHLAQKK